CRGLQLRQAKTVRQRREQKDVRPLVMLMHLAAWHSPQPLNLLGVGQVLGQIDLWRSHESENDRLAPQIPDRVKDSRDPLPQNQRPQEQHTKRPLLRESLGKTALIRQRLARRIIRQWNDAN